MGLPRGLRPGPEKRAGRPSILSCVVDLANVLTLLGLMCSGAAILSALRGSFHLAGVLLIGAYLADLLDGPVARRATARTSGMGRFGANLDSLADLIGCGVCPGIVLLAYSGGDPWLLGGSLTLLASAAMRLAYFNTYGLDDSGGYTGIPTDYVILFFAGLLLLEGRVPHAAYTSMLLTGALAAAAMMVAPIQVPKLGGRWYLYFPALAVAIASGHVMHMASG